MISINILLVGKSKTRQAETDSLIAGIFMPVVNCRRDDLAVIHGRGYGVETGNKRVAPVNTSPTNHDRRKPAMSVLIEAITVTLNDGFINILMEAVMPNITILSKEIRLHNGLFNLNDVHKSSGREAKHRPYLFMRNAQTKELIAEIEKGTDSCFLEVVKGRTGGTYVCKELIYAYAMWISPKFHLAVIRAFDQMQTGQGNSSELPNSPTPKQALAVAQPDPAQTITIVTIIEPGKKPQSQTHQGKVALMPSAAILEYDKQTRAAIWNHQQELKRILDNLLVQGITGTHGQTDPLDVGLYRKKQIMDVLEGVES